MLSTVRVGDRLRRTLVIDSFLKPDLVDFRYWAMFAILQLAMLIGFQTSGRDSADKLASEDGTCDPQYS